MAMAAATAKAISEPRIKAAARIARMITATRMPPTVIFRRARNVGWFAGSEI
jgi:hypothetical protein